MPPAPAASLQGDDLRRLRWRSRRGLLENDLLVARFLDRHAQHLTPPQVETFQRVLDLSEAELLDLFLCRSELPAGLDTPLAREMLEWMRSA